MFVQNSVRKMKMLQTLHVAKTRFYSYLDLTKSIDGLLLSIKIRLVIPSQKY